MKDATHDLSSRLHCLHDLATAKEDARLLVECLGRKAMFIARNHSMEESCEEAESFSREHWAQVLREVQDILAHQTKSRQEGDLAGVSRSERAGGPERM